ncbi:Eukaryotic translation initiation factor 3 subunit I [Chamberlinius hualienensis]
MKPLLLHGHERAITQIKYNREGDLLFSCSKDLQPNVWYSLNGERLGTFNGHTGAVWCMDVNWDSTKVITGAADNNIILWDLEKGSQIYGIETNTAVRTCNFSYSGRMLMFSTDNVMKHKCEIHIVDTGHMASGQSSPILRIPVDDSKVTAALWSSLDQIIITGHDDGVLSQWDLRMGKLLTSVKEHKSLIGDMQYSKDQSMIITASKDHSAKLFVTESLELMKTYKTDRPVNSAALSPIMDHVILGGGQEAMDVTTTSTKAGKFEARFFHFVFEEEFARVKGHFGPINSVAFHPNGKSYSSGGEDGYVRIHNFDQSYFDFQFEC